MESNPTIRLNLALAAALLLGLLAAPPAPAAEEPAPGAAGDDYAHVKGFVERRWFDMAERAAAKIAEPREAALARAVLARGRAEAEPDAQKRLALCDEADARLADFRAAAGAASCAACVEPTSGGKLCHACATELPSSCALGASVKRQLSRV